MSGDLFKLNQRLDDHDKRFDEQERSFNRLIETQQANTAAISQITRQLSQLIEDTSAIVKLHKDFQGAARVGVGIQGFMIWCLKWGAIGTGVVTGIMWLVDQFKH